MERLLAIVVGVIALVSIGATGWFLYQTPGAVFPDDPPPRTDMAPVAGDPVLVTVAPGQSAKDIGGALQAEGIIRSGRLFQILVGITGVQNSLEAGEYEFDRNLPAIEAVHRIAEGRTASRQVVIPEGRRTEEIGELLEAEGIVTAAEFLGALDKAAYSYPFLKQVDGSLEGFLFPARYEFSRVTTAGQVVDTMLLGFQDNVANNLQLEGQEMSLYEVVTLAAVVEREAATAAERPIIAGVFLNRLRAGIPLQADPTVQYALASDAANVAQFGWWKQPLLFADLEFDSPYNTYRNGGLPPGPIANPGLDAIQAVVRPADTDFLYFVARDDGTHVFAETLEEHAANVAMYQPE